MLWLQRRKVNELEYSILGISPASEFYKLTFRNSVSVPSSWVGRSGIYTGKEGEAMEWRDPIGEREEWGW
jgi:hypothetical protein